MQKYGMERNKNYLLNEKKKSFTAFISEYPATLEYYSSCQFSCLQLSMYHMWYYKDPQKLTKHNYFWGGRRSVKYILDFLISLCIPPSLL